MVLLLDLFIAYHSAANISSICRTRTNKWTIYTHTFLYRKREKLTTEAASNNCHSNCLKKQFVYCSCYSVPIILFRPTRVIVNKSKERDTLQTSQPQWSTIKKKSLF